jgi:N-methylhydantoinase A/oxoprolinase/acetone carboxylase beta subunit
MTWRIGIDIGGTFTDVALVEEDTGRMAIIKLPTTPQDYARVWTPTASIRPMCLCCRTPRRW